MTRALALLLLCACGSSAGTTETTTPTPVSTVSPEEAADPPDIEGLAPAGFLAEASNVERASVPVPALDARTQCGRVGARPLGEEISLLEGRLHMRPVEGAIVEPRPWNIMGAPEPTTSETRLFLEAGAEKVVVMVYELFAYAGMDFIERVREDAAESFPGASLEHVGAIGDGLEALQVVPPSLDTSSEAVFTYGLYVVSPDRTVQVLAFYVNPEIAREGACTTLALRSAQTLRAGERRIDTSARTWTLVSGVRDRPLQLPLPAQYTVITQEGPDFWVHRIRRVSIFGTGGPGGLIYFGGHPSPSRGEGAETFEGPLLRESATWIRWQNATHRAEAVREVDQHWFTHASVLGENQDAVAPLIEAFGRARLGE